MLKYYLNLFLTFADIASLCRIQIKKILLHKFYPEHLKYLIFEL